MRRILVMFIAVLMIALMPAVAGAQTVEEKAEALAAFEAAVDGMGGEAGDEWVESAAALRAALVGLEAAFGDAIDTEALNAALDALDAAIAGGDAAAIAAAGEAVAAEAAAVAAAAEGGEGGEGEEGGNGTEEPTAVNTGSPVDDGPSVILLGVAALLVLLAGGALVLRWTADRR